MLVQGDLPLEGVAALLAGEAPLRVDLHVPVQVELEYEGLLAEVALVRPSSRVDHQVLCQMALLKRVSLPFLI